MMETEHAQDIQSAILHYIENSPQKVTPLILEKSIAARLKISRRQIKTALANLLNKGLLIYTYCYGSSFLEKPYYQAIRVTEHVVIRPPRLSFKPEPDDVVITLETGAAFGSGRHPSTRLALEGIEFGLQQEKLLPGKPSSQCLDIGTGSGILAITALGFGIQTAFGTDIDPCARFEALGNARHNGLENRFQILETPLNKLDLKFDLISSNLRLPTLIRLCPTIRRLARPEGVVVVSGVKIEEQEHLLLHYCQHGFLRQWYKSLHAWAGFVFVKKPAKGDRDEP